MLHLLLVWTLQIQQLIHGAFLVCLLQHCHSRARQPGPEPTELNSIPIVLIAYLKLYCIKSVGFQLFWSHTSVGFIKLCTFMCDNRSWWKLPWTMSTIPDVGALWCFKDKAVIGVERWSFLLHLDSPRVELVCAPDMKQPCPIHVVAVRVSPVLEATGPASSMHHHPPLEDQQEVVRFLVLHYTHLNRSSTILVIEIDCMQRSWCLLILTGLLGKKWWKFNDCILLKLTRCSVQYGANVSSFSPYGCLPQ